MEKYSIFIDLDGTLLVDWFTPNSKDLKFILSNKDKFNFYINTGRPTRFTKPIYDALELNTPMSCYNGALCFNPSDKNFPTCEDKLNHLEIKEIINLFSDKLISSYAEINDTVHIHKDMGKYKELVSKGTVIDGDLLEVLNDDVHSCVCIVKDDYIDEFIEYVNNKTNLSARSWGKENKNVIEFFHKDINKGKTTKHIIEQLNLNFEKTICFGDELNDIQMLENVKFGVVMGNAKPDRLGKYAKIQTVTNKEGGISTYLTDLLNNDIEKYNK